MRKIVSLLSVLMLICSLAYGQVRTITGQVKDSKGAPVPFASITIKGTTLGASADNLGNFKIDVREGESLIISSANFAEQEIKVGKSNELLVTLQLQGTTMQEVVVTALGIRRTRNQTPYAAQQIKGEEVSKNRNNNFVQNLSGKISGLDIKQTNTMGGSTNVLIRGTKSLTGDNQALFVVDGVPFNNANTSTANQRTGRGGYDYGSAAADINPDDIETITVLKGAAASALYGSQGSNGVILITTKKGRRGLGITVNTGVTVGKIDKSTFAEYQKEYGAGYGRYYEDPTNLFLYRDINGDGTSDLVTPLSEDASYGAAFDANKMVYQWDAFDPASPNYGKARPWLPAANDPTTFFRSAITSNQSIYIDGASDKGSFKLGYTRTDDRGILPNSSIYKNLANFGGSYNITSKLTAAAALSFSNIEGKGRYGTGYDDKNLMTNFRQWWQTNVDIKEQEDAYYRNKKNVTWNWADPTALVPIYWDNPFFTRYENFQNDSRNRYFGNINVNYKITNWLNILGRVSLDSYDEIQEERQALGSVTVSSYTRFNRSYRETNYDLLMNMDKDLSTDLNFKALLGTNIRRQHTESIRASTNGGLIVERIYSLSNTANPINAPVEFDGLRQVNGVFVGTGFTWRDLITVDATLRRDASSTLPQGQNNNTYYYPSVSAGLIFSKLLPSFDWLSYGKLRANYAQVGNDAPLYSVDDVYTIVPPFGSNPQASVGATKNNPDLLPERTKSYEFGLEVALFKSRAGFDISYYNAKTVDQIYPVVLSTATGYSSKFLNTGTIENRGVELTAYGTPVQTTDFSWNINLNWTRNRNEVTELFEDADNLSLATFQGGVSINASLGQPYGTIRGQNFIYTNGQRTVGANGRYLVTSTSNEVIGNANPDWIGGINNAFKYKNLALSFLVDVRKGGDIFSLDLYYGLATGIYPETAGLNDLGNPSRNTIADGGGIILPGVKADGKPNDTRVENVDFGIYGYRRNPAAGFVYDASYVKLREVLLTYSLPAHVINRLAPFKGIDFSLIGRNLWIIHKNIPHADPEESINSGNLQGYQGGAYPALRTAAFNIKFRF